MPFQPGNGILFAVDDLNAAVASLRERGIPIVMERESPNCNMAVIEDTEGNSIFLHKRKGAIEDGLKMGSELAAFGKSVDGLDLTIDRAP